MNKSKIIIQPGESSLFLEAQSLIYESSHELLNFMFLNSKIAQKVLGNLYQKKYGHFSYIFSTVAIERGKVVGMEIGYDKKQLEKQNFIGSVSLLLNSPISIWWHLINTSSHVIDSYVPKPTQEFYYINNIAVCAKEQGKGIGKLLLENVINRAHQKNYIGVELDVTSVNDRAIKFYQKQGFSIVSESGNAELNKKYGLPILYRMLHKF